MNLFFGHLSLVAEGKGFDLQNLTNLELSRLKNLQKPIKQYKLSKEFDTPSLHAYLRSKLNILMHAGRFFGPNKNPLSVQAIRSQDIRRYVLLSLLFKKRFQKATKLESNEPLTIPIQKITHQDVLDFIQSDRNPVVEFVLSIQKMEQEFKRKQMEENRSGRIYRKFTGKDTCLCLLQSITTEEFATAMVQMTALAVEEFDAYTIHGIVIKDKNISRYNKKNQNTVKSQQDKKRTVQQTRREQRQKIIDELKEDVPSEDMDDHEMQRLIAQTARRIEGKIIRESMGIATPDSQTRKTSRPSSIISTSFSANNNNNNNHHKSPGKNQLLRNSLIRNSFRGGRGSSFIDTAIATAVNNTTTDDSRSQNRASSFFTPAPPPDMKHRSLITNSPRVNKTQYTL
jgi:hypothetical protein